MVIAPNPEFVYRPMIGREPFAAGDGLVDGTWRRYASPQRGQELQTAQPVALVTQTSDGRPHPVPSTSEACLSPARPQLVTCPPCLFAGRAGARSNVPKAARGDRGLIEL